MLSAGMFEALALSTAVRRRGLLSMSPPPMRAAIVISRMTLVKSLPRLASSAPFLCLMECHFECPDMSFSYRILASLSKARGRCNRAPLDPRSLRRGELGFARRPLPSARTVHRGLRERERRDMVGGPTKEKPRPLSTEACAREEKIPATSYSPTRLP